MRNYRILILMNGNPISECCSQGINAMDAFELAVENGWIWIDSQTQLEAVIFNEQTQVQIRFEVCR